MDGGNSRSPTWRGERRGHRGPLQDLDVAEQPAVQQHLLEPQVVAGRAVEEVTTAPVVRFLCPVHVGGDPGAVLAADVNRRGVGPLPRRHPRRGARHAERPGDVLKEIGVQRLPAHRLDHLAQPVDVDPVLEPGARVGHHRHLEHVDRAGHHVGRGGDLLVVVDVGVPDPIAETRRVRDELLHGGLHAGRAELRGVAVEPGEHGQVGELGPVLPDRRVQAQAAALDELEGGRGGDHLGHGRDPHHRVRRDRVVRGRGTPACQTHVEHPVR